MGYVTGGGASGGGSVTSVAGRTGVVTLAVSDVSGAAPLADPTFTGTVTLPSVSFASHKATNMADPTASTDGATKSYVDGSATPGVAAANADLAAWNATAAVNSALLVPTFYPVKQPSRLYTLSQLATRVTTSVAASTIGLAIYSIAYSGSGTFSATLVAQLNASVTGTATGLRAGAVTTGAVGSGAATAALDFTQNQYIVGLMTSTVTTLALPGGNPPAGLGCLLWTAAARSSVTDWPSSFTNSSAGALSTSRINYMALINADGTNWL